jgi:hypothetical protein
MMGYIMIIINQTANLTKKRESAEFLTGFGIHQFPYFFVICEDYIT